MSTIAELCQREVVELHAFFEQWFNGLINNTDAVFARCANVFSPTFQLVTPSGRLLDQLTVLGQIRNGHASFSAEQPLHIEIRNYQHRLEAGQVAVVTYEEWQHQAGQQRGRLSTAVMRVREQNLLPVEWLHVHETWVHADH